jgi:hypothetical protein
LALLTGAEDSVEDAHGLLLPERARLCGARAHPRLRLQHRGVGPRQPRRAVRVRHRRVPPPALLQHRHPGLLHPRRSRRRRHCQPPPASAPAAGQRRRADPHRRWRRRDHASRAQARRRARQRRTQERVHCEPRSKPRSEGSERHGGVRTGDGSGQLLQHDGTGRKNRGRAGLSRTGPTAHREEGWGPEARARARGLRIVTCFEIRATACGAPGGTDGGEQRGSRHKAELLRRPISPLLPSVSLSCSHSRRSKRSAGGPSTSAAPPPHQTWRWPLASSRAPVRFVRWPLGLLLHRALGTLVSC